MVEEAEALDSTASIHATSDASVMLPQMFPMMYPTFIPVLMPMKSQEGTDHGAGIYAVPLTPFVTPTAGVPPSTLIPLDYRIPTANPPEGGMESGEIGRENRQQQLPDGRVVIRRFHFGFQLDLLLILKLAAMVFVFNQDGSRQRLLSLLLFAAIAYLYQTGALAPIMRWLSQGMRRPGVPPRPGLVARADNGVAIQNPNDGNGRPEDEAGNLNVHQLVRDQVAENQNGQNGGRERVTWWGVVKEIQLLAVSFITSLFPGYHNVD